MVTKQFRLSSSKNCAELQKCVGMAERDEADATILLSRPETGYRVPINADARVTPNPSWTLAIFQRRRKLLLTSSRVAACNAPRRHRGRARVNRQLNLTGSESKVMAAGIHPGLARAELPGPLVRERRMSDATARKVPSSLAVWMQPFRDVVTAPPDNTCGCSWRERSSFPACELSPPRCASWSAPRFRARPTTAACRTATNGPPAELVRRLFGLRVDTFVPGDKPVVVGLDDTIERRWGASIKKRDIYRGPVRFSRGHFVKASGRRWLALMVVPRAPLAGCWRAIRRASASRRPSSAPTSTTCRWRSWLFRLASVRRDEFSRSPPPFRRRGPAAMAGTGHPAYHAGAARVVLAGNAVGLRTAAGAGHGPTPARRRPVRQAGAHLR